MIHPSTEVRRIDDVKGHGLFATASIPMGTITWVKDQLDREISPEALMAYHGKLQETIIHFSYRNRRGNYVFCWDNTRYMNHDNNPNTCITPYELEIAVRDIQAGEEVTNHYGMLNIIEPFTLFEDASITIYPDDLLRHSGEWDSLLRAAFPSVALVDQPLYDLVPSGTWAEICEISRGARVMKSVSDCYFAGYR